MKIAPISFSLTHRDYNNSVKSGYSKKIDKNLTRDTFSFSANPLQLLEKEYFTMVKSADVTLVKAFLKLSGDENTMDGLLTRILTDKETSFPFIAEICSNPREALKFGEILPEKVGRNSSNVLTFMFNSPYTHAYNDFILNKYNTASSVGELLAIRPDWRGDALLKKHKSLNGDCGFELGKVPDELSKDDLFGIADYLKGFLQNSGAKSPMNINSIDMNSGRIGFDYFIDGKTDKNVFGLNLSNGKQYIMKMAKEDARSLDAPFALGTLAKIDTYLTLNKSRNSAPLLYYNHDKNFLIYEFVQHNSVSGDSRNLTVISQHIPDYKALGLQFNDSVGSNNCFLMNQNSNQKMLNTFEFSKGIEAEEWISVDNDHVTFTNFMHPQLRELHSYLPNAMQFCV